MTIAKRKYIEQEEIKKKTEEFLKKGGKIKVIENNLCFSTARKAYGFSRTFDYSSANNA